MHEPLQIDASLSWDELIAAAFTAHPERFELAARGAEADAWRTRGGNWLAGTPSVYFAYLSDRSLDNLNQREYEAGVELPLWRLRQRRATRAVADAAFAAVGTAGRSLQWHVAGSLRVVLWDIAAAANSVESAQASLAVADELVRVVERRNAAGDLPQSDVLLARKARVDAQRLVVESEALLADAERIYRSLTNLNRRPAQFAEVLTDLEGLDTSHPALALADAELERARASLELVDREIRGSPVLTIGPRSQRDPFGTSYNDSLTVGLKLPFGGKPQGGTEYARAARTAAAVESQRAQLLRQLDIELHESEHTLFVVEQSLELAERQVELATRQWSMGQVAFGQGEIELRELLRIQESAQSATQDVGRLRIERQRSIAAINQAVGEIP